MHATGRSDTPKYIPAAEIRKRFHVCNGTLQRWANEGRIGAVRLKGGHGKRLYKEDDLDNVIAGFKTLSEKEPDHRRVRVCYARVSSAKQKEDLQRQIQLLGEAYPNHEIVKDVASGINWKRSGFTSLLDRVLRGDVEEVVVSHRDRLCRFAFDLVKHVFERSGCKLVVHDETPRGNDGVGELESAETELRDDLLAIVTVFVASNNGRRAAAHRRERREKATREQKEGEEEGPRESSADEEAEEEERRPEELGGDQVHEVQDLPGRKPESNTETVDGRHEVGVQPDGGEPQREGAGDERVAGVAAGMGRDRGRGVDEDGGGRRAYARTVRKRPVRSAGLADPGHGRCVHGAPKQGEGVETEAQVPPEKRRRDIDHPPDATAQLQDGPGERVAVAVRDGAQ
jgi:putative resolvase